jgi:hypothetical protein
METDHRLCPFFFLIRLFFICSNHRTFAGLFFGSVVQLDRTSDSGSEGRGFEGRGFESSLSHDIFRCRGILGTQGGSRTPIK